MGKMMVFALPVIRQDNRFSYVDLTGKLGTLSFNESSCS